MPRGGVVALSRAQADLEAGRWESARDHFRASLAEKETPEAREGLGWALFWIGEPEAGLQERERAFALYRRRGDHEAAARAALALGVDSVDVRGLAVALGWFERARTIAAEVPPGLLHGWVALWDGHVARIASRDPALARSCALRASETAARHGSVELAMLSRALEGLALVDEGAVAEGMRRLDEATAAALAEMTDLDAAGTTCCFLIHACQSVRDYERGSQWAERIRTFADRYSVRQLLSSCEPSFAALLLGRGEWREAEALLERAEEGLTASRPFALPEVCEVLGELRRRQGRAEEAESLFARAGSRSAAALGRAALAFDRGDARGAGDLIERFLRSTAAENWSGRAAALGLLVDVRLRAGGPEAAAPVLRELASLAALVSLPFVESLRCQAEGRVLRAAGKPEEARRAFEDAVDGFVHCSAPWEEARARIDLARALLGCAREEAARREAEAARTSLERLGAESEVRRAGDLLAEIVRAPRRSRVTARERDVLRHAAEGLSEREIAARLGLSEHTVHRHVANVLRKLGLPSRTAAVAWALKSGAL